MDVDGVSPFVEYRDTVPPTDSFSATSSPVDGRDPLDIQDEEDEKRSITDLRIIEVEQISPDDRKLLERVHTALRRDKVPGVRWVKEEDLFKELQEPGASKAVFVVPKFEGKAFDALRNRRCSNVYGPRCILTCLEREWPLPQNPRFPIATMALRNVEVCCSNMLPQQRDVVHAKVTGMGGKAHRQLLDTVTHLITPTVGSTKYLAAVKNKKAIVAPDWVEHMWTLSNAGQQDCNSQDNLRKFELDIFTGVEISVSQLDLPVRSKTKKLLVENGGVFRNEFDRKTVKFLISTSMMGEKCEAAKKWKIPVVFPKWIEDSVEKGFCLDHKEYLVSPPGSLTPKHIKQGSNGLRATSTPNRGARGLDHSLDISAIPHKTDERSRLTPIPEGVINAIVLAEDTVRGHTQAVTVPMVRTTSDEENAPGPSHVPMEIVPDTLIASQPSVVVASEPSSKTDKPPENVPRVPTVGKPGVLPLSKRILNLEPDLSPQAPKDLKTVRNELIQLIAREKPVKPAPRLPKVFVRPKSVKRRGRLVWSQAERNPFKHPPPKMDDDDEDNNAASDDEDTEAVDEDVDMEEAVDEDDAESPRPPSVIAGSTGSSGSSSTKSTTSVTTSTKSTSSLTTSTKTTPSITPTTSGANSITPSTSGTSSTRSASSGNIPTKSTPSGSAGTKSTTAIGPGVKLGSSGLTSLGVAPSLLPGGKVPVHLIGNKQKSAEEVMVKGGNGLPKTKSADVVPGAVGRPNLANMNQNVKGGVGGSGKKVEEKADSWGDLDLDDAAIQAVENAEKAKAAVVNAQKPVPRPLTPLAPPPPPVFCFSGVGTEAEKKALMAGVTQLGGTFIDSIQYEPACTHLLIKSPTRNEKFLAYVAAGQWILHMQYIQDSVKVGHFLPEEMYEWGNMEKAASLNTNIKSPDLAHSACFWRKHVKATGKGAFAGWKVVLVADAARGKGYARVLQAGGASVIADKPPFSAYIQRATHMLHEQGKVALDPAELARFKAAGVAYHQADYLAQFLCAAKPDSEKAAKSRLFPQEDTGNAKRIKR